MGWGLRVGTKVCRMGGAGKQEQAKERERRRAGDVCVNGNEVVLRKRKKRRVVGRSLL